MTSLALSLVGASLQFSNAYCADMSNTLRDASIICYSSGCLFMNTTLTEVDGLETSIELNAGPSLFVVEVQSTHDELNREEYMYPNQGANNTWGELLRLHFSGR